jgi:hypothetical protein
VAEIIEAILEHAAAANVRCLVAAARVNRLWADVATGLLWHMSSGAALAYVYSSDGGSSSGSRSAYYDRKVRHITVADSNNASGYAHVAARYSDLQSWRLPHVTQLTLVQPSSGTDAAALLQRVLDEQQPLVRLRELKWHCHPLAAADDAYALNNIYFVLLRHAPRMSLHSLSLNTVNAVLGTADLLALLKALPSLTSAELEGPMMGGVLDDAVLTYLALNPRLTHLRLVKRVALHSLSPLMSVSACNLPLQTASSTATTTQILTHTHTPISTTYADNTEYFRNETPFCSIRSFGYGTTPRAVPSYAAMLCLLTRFDITLHASDFAMALHVISRSLALRSLRIIFSCANDSARTGGSSSSNDDNNNSDAVTDTAEDGNADTNKMLLRPGNFLKLTHLKLLCVLQLAMAPLSRDQGDIDMPHWQFSRLLAGTLDRGTFFDLVLGLPQLRCLSVDLGVALALTTVTLGDVGYACRKLEVLKLRGHFWLSELPVHGLGPAWTMFPCLTTLELSVVHTEYDIIFDSHFSSRQCPPSFPQLTFFPRPHMLFTLSFGFPPTAAHPLPPHLTLLFPTFSFAFTSVTGDKRGPAMIVLLRGQLHWYIAQLFSGCLSDMKFHFAWGLTNQRNSTASPENT